MLLFIMAMANQVGDLKDEDLDDIRSYILTKRDNNGFIPNEELYLDPSFPPDITSLTYVYSGDDKYEQMVFKRPQELCASPVLCGVYGSCNITLPWQPIDDKSWFVCALAVVSLNQRFIDRLIPGLSEFNQDFCKNYTGAFQIVLWQFDEWVEIVIDDFLPVLDGRLAFCPSFGNPPEYWGTLIEKAYAKCYKTYEAIESGRTVDALVDLTGAICEHFSVAKTTSLQLFHVLHRSCANRSMVTCLPSESGARQIDQVSCREVSQGELNSRHQGADIMVNRVYLITATTKFPLRDGTMLEMVRVKDLYCEIPFWTGEFSPKSNSSWNRVNPAFMKNYRPRESREDQEFWMCLRDFSRHFADVIICSSPEVYRGIDSLGERRYKQETADEFTAIERMTFSSLDSAVETSTDDLGQMEKYDCYREAPAGTRRMRRRGDYEITKLDAKPSGEERMYNSRHDSCSNGPISVPITNNSNPDEVLFFRSGVSVDKGGGIQPTEAGSGSGVSEGHGSAHPNRHRNRLHARSSAKSRSVDNSDSHVQNIPSLVRMNAFGGGFSPRTATIGNSPVTHQSYNSESAGSNGHGVDARHPLFLNMWEDKASTSSYGSVSNVSDVASTHSMSEVKIKVKDRITDSLYHRSETTSLPARCDSQCSYTSQTSIFESRMDYFRAHGGWREVISRVGKWKKSCSGGPRTNMAAHTNNPRIALVLPRCDSTSEVLPLYLQGRCHVIVSLLQDYRHGRSGSGGLLVPIGFCIYKTKHPERDEKRHLSKLPLAHEISSSGPSRQVTVRLDLEPGAYFVVPFTADVGHEGEFTLTVLGEVDSVTGKAGCALS